MWNALRIGLNSDDHITRLYRADGAPLFDSNPKVVSAELNDSVQEALNGKQQYDLIDDHDGTFNDAGKFGVWTKADSIIQFDNLTATPK